MPPEAHQRVRRLFEEALDCPEGERLPFLKAACSGDTEAFDAVVRLLDAHAAAPQSFLENQPPGLQLIDRYVITGELGRGAMGIVYEATDPRFSRNVAIKVIHPQWLASPDEANLMRERLFREARASGALLHPGIVTIFDVGQEGGLAFIVMERVEGPSIEKILASDDAPDRSRTLDILRQAATALDYAHTNGVAHCDVKPANIMLHRGATVKLTDFGIAKVVSIDLYTRDLYTRAGPAMGTPAYMSPEQIGARAVDGRSDQFSLAVVAYEMLTGSRPFQAESVTALAHMIVDGPRPSARTANPALPAAVDDVFHRAFGNLPEERYSSCAEFVMALETAVKYTFEPASHTAVLSPAAPAPASRTARIPLPYLVGAPAALILALAALFFARSSERVAQVLSPAVIADGQFGSQWQRQLIQTVADGRTTNWPYPWHDISWDGQEGWLGGEIVADGVLDQHGVRHVGTGILLHTTNQGASWTPIDKTLFNSGHGKFPWGPHGDYKWEWREVGPIYALHVYPRPPGGDNEIWVAATTGMYYSEDNGKTWRRSTPRPDDPNHPEIYAHFANLFNIDTFGEIFAVGWQGISRWSSANRVWELQIPTYSYLVNAVFAYSDSPAWDVWAVGQSGIGDSHGTIYHLREPDNAWEAFTATGVELEKGGGGLRDIQLVDSKTGFAVGSQGVIVKGSKSKAGIWSWAGLTPSPATTDLNSIVYADHALWIVGNDGIVLSTKDLGLTWNVSRLKDENGDSPALKRVRSFGHSLWIVGNGVVYKRHL
jgi:tRNA A-37 threonylcarbamoyl transferase component Bud32